MIKIIINTIVTIVLGTGTIQGAASYGEYYEKDLESFHCDFNHHQRKYDSDIDFLAVVIVSGISAFVWVRKYVYIHCYSYQHSNRDVYSYIICMYKYIYLCVIYCRLFRL